jgi:dihydrofolate reductase
MIVGRRTFEFIGKPLPGRFNIVLTQNPEYRAPDCGVARTFPAALSLAEEYLARTGGDEVMIIGGGKVYAETIECWDRLYLTVVAGEFPGSTYFPVRTLLRQTWRPACAPETHPADAKNPYPHSFHIIDRVWDAARRSPQREDAPLARACGDSEQVPEGLDLAAILERGTMDS